MLEYGPYVGMPRALEHFEERRRRIAIEESKIPKYYAEWRLSDYAPRKPEHRTLRANAEDWISKFKVGCKGLALVGEVGTGKTRLACAIASMIHVNHMRFQSVSELFSDLRSCWSDGAPRSEREIINDLTHVNLLILDDIGATKGSTNMLGKMLEIVDGLMLNKGTLIYTSNHKLNEIKEHWSKAGLHGEGLRFTSRLLQMCESIGEFPKQDLRVEDAMAALAKTKQRGQAK